MSVSERVKKYKEERLGELYDNYGINTIDKFMVEELVNLENEYRSLIPSKDNVLTRKSMLEMIDRAKSRLFLKKKDDGILYFDISRATDKTSGKCIIYYDNKVYNLFLKDKGLTLKDYANYIYGLVKDKNVKVYCDKMSLSIGVCDELELLGIKVLKLSVENPFKYINKTID